MTELTIDERITAVTDGIQELADHYQVEISACSCCDHIGIFAADGPAVDVQATGLNFYPRENQ